MFFSPHGRDGREKGCEFDTIGALCCFALILKKSHCRAIHPMPFFSRIHTAAPACLPAWLHPLRTLRCMGHQCRRGAECTKCTLDNRVGGVCGLDPDPPPCLLHACLQTSVSMGCSGRERGERVSTLTWRFLFVRHRLTHSIPFHSIPFQSNPSRVKEGCRPPSLRRCVVLDGGHSVHYIHCTAGNTCIHGRTVHTHTHVHSFYRTNKRTGDVCTCTYVCMYVRMMYRGYLCVI